MGITDVDECVVWAAVGVFTRMLRWDNQFQLSKIYVTVVHHRVTRSDYDSAVLRWKKETKVHEV